MTHPTDEELENHNRQASAAMRGMHKTACYEQGDHPDECDSYFSLAADALDAIAALRAKLAAANDRADRAEAALAAQIDVDAGLMERRADDLSDAVKWGGSKQYITSLKGGEVELRNAAKLIRNQPHDRTALDRLLADAEAKALRRAAKACDWGDIYGDNAVKCILALIPKEGEA